MALKKKKTKKGTPCLILSTHSAMLGRGEMIKLPEDGAYHVHVSRGDTYKIIDEELVQLSPIDHELPSVVGRVSLAGTDKLLLESLRKENEAVRQNFRMPVDFDSFLYPQTGGRASCHSLNLSSGGIAVYTGGRFVRGEILEIVIPIVTVPPLIVNLELLRVQPRDEASEICAGRFVDLLDEEEAYIREAVFQAQMRDMVRKRAAARR